MCPLSLLLQMEMVLASSKISDDLSPSLHFTSGMALSSGPTEGTGRCPCCHPCRCERRRCGSTWKSPLGIAPTKPSLALDASFPWFHQPKSKHWKVQMVQRTIASQPPKAEPVCCARAPKPPMPPPPPMPAGISNKECYWDFHCST